MKYAEIQTIVATNEMFCNNYVQYVIFFYHLVVSDDCKSVELISGDHWVPDSALKSSSVRDKDSGAENSRIDWAATGVFHSKLNSHYHYRCTLIVMLIYIFCNETKILI